MFILKSRLKDYVARHRQQERIRTIKEYTSLIKEKEKDFETEMILSQKDFEIELEELRQLVRYYKQREKIIQDQQNQIIRDRASIAEASSKLYNWMNMLGEVILKSGRECEGIFQKVDRMLAIDKNNVINKKGKS